jgi:multiple sugar transport system ATP-binding protein
MSTVALRDIHKRYTDIEIIKGVDLDIHDREFVVFVGPSGCGKSTLLRMIAGLEEISSGDLLIDGERVNDVPPDKRGLAMVFQTYALYPHMTVAENMAFSLRLAGMSKQQRHERARDVARILQLEPLLNRKPKELSGGQRQRVAIGRALVRNPKVFLFDEAMTLADKIVVLQGGIVEQVGSPLDLYHQPRNLFVAGFIGSPRMNFLAVTVSAVNDSGTTVKLPGDATVTIPVKPGSVSVGERVTLGIRPEHLRLDQTNANLNGEVLVVERLGGATYLYVKIAGGETLVVQTDGDNFSQLHDIVPIQIRGELCHLFDQQGVSVPKMRRHHLTNGSHEQQYQHRVSN